MRRKLILGLIIPLIGLSNTSATNENASTQYNLGTKYFNTRNFEQALPLFKEAAEQGISAAQFHLGEMYEYGWGIDRDIQQAIFWYKKAAEQGFARAQLFLGIKYDRDYSIKDMQQARYWFEKAAIQGELSAQKNLAELNATDNFLANITDSNTYKRRAYTSIEVKKSILDLDVCHQENVNYTTKIILNRLNNPKEMSDYDIAREGLKLENDVEVKSSISRGFRSIVCEKKVAFLVRYGKAPTNITIEKELAKIQQQAQEQQYARQQQIEQTRREQEQTQARQREEQEAQQEREIVRQQRLEQQRIEQQEKQARRQEQWQQLGQILGAAATVYTAKQTQKANTARYSKPTPTYTPSGNQSKQTGAINKIVKPVPECVTMESEPRRGLSGSTYYLKNTCSFPVAVTYCVISDQDTGYDNFVNAANSAQQVDCPTLMTTNKKIGANSRITLSSVSGHNRVSVYRYVCPKEYHWVNATTGNYTYPKINQNHSCEWGDFSY